MNRLAGEKSAYLQHAKDQKIDWYPWCDEAFEKAGAENKPVFLSSGAVWCHWCHVMARESFEDEEVARILNERFVAVKLDRDERPDIDRRYQTAVAAMGFSGGWPLSVFLTPGRSPFYGGTYFPPRESFGRPGFKGILMSISALWRDKKAEIEVHGGKLFEMLRPEPYPAGEISEGLLRKGAAKIIGSHDARRGGFGTAPKFPMSGALEVLLGRFFLARDESLGKVAKTTLARMAEGGIYDHLGGGFHRYSTDEEWIVPHFEKMTDDNAWLLRNYLDGYAIFGEPRFRETAEGIIRFFMAELSHEEGGFYASQDADVVPEDEGGYFTWTDEDFKAVLDEREYKVLSLHFLHEKGSMHHDPSKKVLFPAVPIEEVARKLHMEGQETGAIIAKGMRKLLEERGKRQKPFVDRAFYTSLNGLAISAFLKACRILGDEGAKAFALKSIDRILEINVSGGQLLHTAGVPALLDDYIFLSDALVAAYEATGLPRYLDRARAFMDTCLSRFRDVSGGGFFDTEEDVLGMRLKGIEDMPHPAANSMAVPVLLKLSFIAGEAAYRGFAEETLRAFAAPAELLGIHGAYYLSALDSYFNMLEITLDAAPASGLAAAVRSRYYPYEAIRYGEDKGSITPCRRGVCFQPLSTIEAFDGFLAGDGSGA